MTTLRDLTARITLETHGTEHLEHLSEQIEGIHKKVELLAGIELAKMAYEWVESFSSVGERLESAAAAAGITTDVFQKMAYAASQNAVSQEELSGSLSRFSRMIGQARDGSKGALAAFAKVGISRDQVLSFTDATDGMQVLADHIQQIQDPIKRTQLMMQLLGRGSANMTKFLTQGGEGIRDKMREASQIGAVVSEANVKQLAELEDSVSSLGGVFKAAAANLAGYFAPALIYAINRIKAFWTANHAVIEQDFQRYAEKVAFALGFVMGFIEKAGEDLFAFVRTHQALIAIIGDAILKFIEFKVATGAVAAAFGFLAGPFKQLGEGLAVIKGVFSVLQAGWPIMLKFGRVLVAFAGDVAAATIGIGGATGAAALAALVVALHDAYTLLTTGKVEDTWLYKLIVAIKSLSLGALKKLGLYDPTQDAATAKAGPLAALDFAGPKASALPDVMANIGDLSHAQNLPPRLLDGNFQGAQASNSYSIDAPITVNVPANADPKAVAYAARDGVSDALGKMLRTAKMNTMQATVY